MQHNEFLNMTLEGKVLGKKTRGRPKTSYLQEHCDTLVVGITKLKILKEIA